MCYKTVWRSTDSGIVVGWAHSTPAVSFPHGLGRREQYDPHVPGPMVTWLVSRGCETMHEEPAATEYNTARIEAGLPVGGVSLKRQGDTVTVFRPTSYPSLIYQSRRSKHVSDTLRSLQMATCGLP